ncbi:hypothetical protein ACFL2Q_02765 [Thermodesulfobacteriota bacterium]
MSSELLEGFERDDDSTLFPEAAGQDKHAMSLCQGTLDSLVSNIAILDESGKIVAVNRSWKRFANNNELNWQDYGIGVSYLRVTDESHGEWSEEAEEVSRGIRDVTAGSSEAYYMEYPCHGPDEKRWFSMRVTRFLIEGAVMVVVAHDNITERKMAELERDELISQLQEALAQVKKLSGFLPICASCKTSMPVEPGTTNHENRWSRLKIAIFAVGFSMQSHRWSQFRPKRHFHTKNKR